MINIKMTVIAGSIAAVLSFIFGLIGDVTGGTVLIRTLLSGLLFAGFFVGMQIILDKFVPGLFDSDSGNMETESKRDESETGEKVNIVLEEESEYVPEPGGIDAGTEFQAGIRTGEVPSPEDSEESPVAQASSGSDEAIHSSGSASEAADSLKDESVSEVEDVEDVEDVEELESQSGSGSANDEGVQDIGVFENTFNSNPSGLDSIKEGNNESGGSFEVLGGTHDTLEAAQAIQTILKKEQEG